MTSTIKRKEPTTNNPLTKLWKWMEQWTGRDWIKLTIINTLSHILGFWSLSFVLSVIGKYKLFYKYKLQKEVFKKTGLVAAALKMNLSYDFLSSPLISWIFEKILRGRFGSLLKENGVEDSKEKDDTKVNGWSGLTFKGKLPSTLTTVWQICVAYLGYDLMFYISHRALHSNLLYMRFHKQHHEFQTPVGLAAIYCHPLEMLLSNVGPLFIGTIIAGSHIYTVYMWTIFAVLGTMTHHCGYDWPWMWYVDHQPNFHDYHHEKFNVNFGKRETKRG